MSISTSKSGKSALSVAVASLLEGQTILLSKVDGLVATQAEFGQRLEAVEARGLTPTTPAKEPKAKKAKAPKVEVDPDTILTPDIDLALDRTDVRCTAKTQAGKRCKVTSRQDICGLHRRQAEIAAAKAKAEAPVVEAERKAQAQAEKAKAGGPVSMSLNTRRDVAEIKSRKAYNSEVMQLAGTTARRVAICKPEAWAKVTKARLAGKTPAQAVAKALKGYAA